MKFDRSCCPVACTLDLMGDKWTMLVVRDLLMGRTQFKQFMAGPEGISTNILSDRLHRLVQYELVERVASQEVAGKVTYQLTSKGKSLKPVLNAIANWGLANIEGTEKRLQAQ